MKRTGQGWRRFLHIFSPNISTSKLKQMFTKVERKNDLLHQ